MCAPTTDLGRRTISARSEQYVPFARSSPPASQSLFRAAALERTPPSMTRQLSRRDLSADSFGQPSVTNSSLTVNQTCPRTALATQRAPSPTVRSFSQERAEPQQRHPRATRQPWCTMIAMSRYRALARSRACRYEWFGALASAVDMRAPNAVAHETAGHDCAPGGQ